jgi:hypothetical protein
VLHQLILSDFPTEVPYNFTEFLRFFRNLRELEEIYEIGASVFTISVSYQALYKRFNFLPSRASI